jgi:hypothetical protein
MIGATKIERVNKTKFRKNEDNTDNKVQKKKHHDKSFYRLMKEDEDYGYTGYAPKTNKRP